MREPAGWSRFCRLYGPLVYAWARHAGLQRADASDVTQEVFLVVVARIEEFERLQERNFRNWLWTICHHVIQAHFRKQGDRPLAVGGTSANLFFSQLEEVTPNEDPLSEFNERTSIVLRVLNSLRDEVPAATWQAFWRTAIGGESASIVASELGVTRWAVYKSKARLLHRIRQELQGLVPLDGMLSISDSDALSRLPS